MWMVTSQFNWSGGSHVALLDMLLLKNVSTLQNAQKMKTSPYFPFLKLFIEKGILIFF